MKNKSLLIATLLLLFTLSAFTQQKAFSVSINLSVDKTVQESFKKDGRLYIFLSKDSMSEPRTQIWPNPRSKTYIFAKNIPDFNP